MLKSKEIEKIILILLQKVNNMCIQVLIKLTCIQEIISEKQALSFKSGWKSFDIFSCSLWPCSVFQYSQWWEKVGVKEINGYGHDNILPK